MEEIDDNKLLEIDLCGRLPHMTLKVKWGNEDYNIIDIGFGRVTVLKPFMSFTAGSPLIREIKPHLRPMSSMTGDEEKEFPSLGEGLTYNKITKEVEYLTDRQIWLDKNCFDYRGLIPRGIALEAPEGMYGGYTRPKKEDRTCTPYRDAKEAPIYEGDIFVYLKYGDFDHDHIPEDLIENWSKYEERVSLHPVFWDDDKTAWCSDVYGDADKMSGYDFTQVVVVTNNIDHPELYNH